MKSKVLGIVVVLMAVAMLATPVMAIGPFNALDVGNSKNLEPIGAAVLNQRGENYKGAILWMMGTSGEHWVRWEWQDAATLAKGLKNNAVTAMGPPSMGYFTALSEENENKWIYLSGDGATYPAQYVNGPDGGKSHGMLWWFWFAVTWASKYAEVIKNGGTQQAAVLAANSAGIAAGNQAVIEHPQGIFWKTNEISGSLP
jgi:hypothetical protein